MDSLCSLHIFRIVNQTVQHDLFRLPIFGNILFYNDIGWSIHVILYLNETWIIHLKVTHESKLILVKGCWNYLFIQMELTYKNKTHFGVHALSMGMYVLTLSKDVSSSLTVRFISPLNCIDNASFIFTLPVQDFWGRFLRFSGSFFLLEGLSVRDQIEVGE